MVLYSQFTWGYHFSNVQDTKHIGLKTRLRSKVFSLESLWILVKSFWVQKFSVKKFWSRKNFSLKKRWVKKKNLRSKNNLGSWKFRVQKLCWVKINFCSIKFWIQKILGPTKFWVLKNSLWGVETLASSCLDNMKPTYQILASYHPSNPRKSFRWWWVVVLQWV